MEKRYCLVKHQGKYTIQRDANGVSLKQIRWVYTFIRGFDQSKMPDRITSTRELWSK